MTKAKKAAVYFSSGIGDALLLTPLVKTLKKDGFHVTGIFTSPYKVHEIYSLTDIIDDCITIMNKPKLVWFMTRYSFAKFEVSYVNEFAARRSLLVAASQTSKEVHTNKKVEFTYDIPENIITHPIQENVHDGLQNILLYKSDVHVKIDDFSLKFNPTDISKFMLPTKYVLLQAGAGNNKTPYKIWETKNWAGVVNDIKIKFPELSIVLVGDQFETSISKEITGEKIIDLCGKTKLNELISIVEGASAMIGSDSGVMHLAAALNKPSFTIWGASNDKLYSYAYIAPDKHQIIYNKSIDCRPCSSWHSANSSRFTDPMMCPDFNCLKNLSSKDVSESLLSFLSLHL